MQWVMAVGECLFTRRGSRMHVLRLGGYPYRVPDSCAYPDAGHTPVNSGTARRVLTISADMGGGHNATADALEEAVRKLWAGSEIHRLDTLDVLGPGIGRLFRAIYVANVERTPWLYEFFYSALWRHRWFARASKRFTGSWCGRRLETHLNRFDPDLILSTYPLGTAGLDWLRRHRGMAIPAGAWVSDFAPHPFWVYRSIDVNFVVHESSVPHARVAEPGATVKVCAPPVVEAFSPGDRREARRAAGLRAEAFVVLVACGAYAFGDVETTVRALLEASLEIQVVAACGHDDATRERLERLGVPRGQLVPLGWTEDMTEYVRAADVVLTNAGGATALEALACGRSVLMCRPIAAHGAANADLMVVSGLAETCATEERLIQHVRSAVADRQAIGDLEHRARDHVGAHDLRSSLADLAATAPDVPTPGRPWPMRPSDAFFSHVESEAVRQELGAVLTLAPVAPGRALDLDTLRRDIARRAPGLAPTRRRIVRRPRRGWALQSSVQIDEHIHEFVLAPDAGDGEAFDAVGQFWSDPMPEDRPAWQMLLVRGQADGRSVMAVKMHHAQGDGISALGLLDRLLTPASDDSLRERRSRSDPDPQRPLRVGLVALRQTGLVGRGLWSLATRGRPPKVGLNRTITDTTRQYAAVPLPAVDLRAGARSRHAQPHELVLAIVADALGRLLGPAGLIDGTETLRVMVPVAMRPPRLDRIFGNWTGSVAVDLPVGPMPPAQRVDAVRHELRRRVRRGEPQAAQAVMYMAGRLPSSLHGRLARLVYTRRFFNTIVSYMPGADQPRWCADVPVRAIYPVLPLTDGVPLTVGVVVADDTVGVGVLADPALGLDRDQFVQAVTGAFDDAAYSPDHGHPTATRGWSTWTSHG